MRAQYEIANPDEIEVVASIDWSVPYSRDILLSGHAKEDDVAHFYSIVAKTDREFWTFYFGVVYEQWVSDRHKQQDHVQRLAGLKASHPNLDFVYSLGVLNVEPRRKVTRSLVEDIEGLLIYANWHEDMANKKKIGNFSSRKSFRVTNKGFLEHLDAEEIVYGVLYRSVD